MSLLIKALDKAQAEKKQAESSADKKSTDKSKKRAKSQGKKSSSNTANPSAKAQNSALSLSPPEESLAVKADAIPAALKDSAVHASQKEGLQQGTARPENAKLPAAALALKKEQIPPTQVQAANVFAAKRTESKGQVMKLAFIIGVIALLMLAAVLYWYQSVMNVPDIVIPPRPVLSQEMPEALPEMAPLRDDVAELEVVAEPIDAAVVPSASNQEVKKDNAVDAPTLEAENSTRAAPVLAAGQEESPIEETLTSNEEVVDAGVNVMRANATSPSVDIASESASIKITQAKTESGVNPILMRAYEAYNAGNDSQAQQDYKQVLQRYGMNVDAMLGLGAIATRQGRLADANGWYRKVLEMEPRNGVAKSSLISLQQKDHPQSGKSNIKSMLGATPKDANLHAALGDIYADQGQWTEAQQAYFDAYRFNPNAENALNLGVSLDQLGKTKLALPYYQEALQNAGQSNVIDTAALEARISTIE